MPATDQVVSVSAAGRPPILRGHHQPLVDAEHILLRGPVISADGEVKHRDQAAQHQPRAHRVHTHPSGRSSVMGASGFAPGCSGPNWTALTQETITKDLCNRLEAEGREGECTSRQSPTHARERCKGLHTEEARV